MMFLAQSQFEPPGGILGWLGCLAFILWIVRLGVGLFCDLKDKPAPSDVRAESHEKFATKAEVEKSVEALETEDKALHSRIGAVDRDAQNRTTEAAQQLRGDLNTASNLMHELKGEMKQLSIQLINVQQELQNR